MSQRLKITALSLVACLSGYCANSQEIKDGFIIRSSGEYQYGFIQLDNTLNVYEECHFATAVGKPYTKYTPDQVMGYGVINGIHFITKEVTTGATSHKHFLKKEIDALPMLYSFHDNRFFIETDHFEELTESNHKALLAEALKSCKNILSSIKKIHFDPQGIRTILIKYQRCTDPESASIPFKRFQFDVVAGAEFNNSKLNGGQAPLGLNIALIDKTLLSAGANAIITFKKSKKLSIVTGVYYYLQNFYVIDQSVASDHSSTDKINLDYSELLIPIALQYSLFKKDKSVMPYIKAGISIPFTVKSTLIWESEKEYVSTVFFERYDLPQKLKQSLQPTISAGTTFNLINNIRNVFEINYSTGRGEFKNNNKSLTINSSRVVVLLGFRF